MYEIVAILVLSLILLGNGIKITRLLELNFSSEFLSIYFIVGVINWILVIFLFRYLGFTFYIPIFGLTILGLFGLYEIKKEILNLTKNFKQIIHKNRLIIISHLTIVLLTLVILSSVGFYQGYSQNGDLIIYKENYHDILWHMALSQTLLNDLPVENPIFSHTPLKGYHYLTDFYWSTVHFLTGISLESLLLKWEVWIFAILFGETSFLLFCKIFPKDLVRSLLSALLLVFAGGLAFYVPFILSGVSNNPSLFWLDQPGNYVINPQLLLSFSLVNVFIAILITSKKWWPILGIILGSLVAIKVYAFLVLGFSFAIVAFRNFLKGDYSYLKGLVVGGGISGVILLLTNVSQGNPFILEPGWFIQTMYVTGDHLNISEWELKRQVFASDNNYLRLAILWIEGLFIFEFGNFGLKLLGLFTIPLVIYMKRKEEIEDWYYLAVVMLCASLILPLMLLQKGVPWSSIQFMHYAQVPLCLLLVSFMTKFSRKTWISLVTVITILGLPTTLLTTYYSWDPSKYNMISTSQIQGLKKIKGLPAESIILVDKSLDQTSLVPAISGRNVYYADPIILDIILVDYSSRVQYLEDIKSSKISCRPNQYLITDGGDMPKNFVGIETYPDLALLKCRSS